MKQEDRWDRTDWNDPGQTEFTGLQLKAGSSFMAILPGGIIAAIALVIWYLAVS